MLISTILFYKSIAAKIKSVGIQVRVSAENILQKITEAVSSIKIVKLTNKNEFLSKMFLSTWLEGKIMK